MNLQKPLSLAQFEIFINVAETLNFTRVAQQLGITKAAISHTVKTLENELGMPLLIRTTRRMALTAEGELLYKQCLRLKRELDATRDLVSGLHSSPQGKLRISTNIYLSKAFLLPKLLIYMKKFPQVDIEIIIEERMPDFQAEQIDLVFGVNWPAPDDIIARKITQTRYVLCASPDYLQQHGTPLTLEELNQHQYICHSGRSKSTPIVNTKKPLTHLQLSSNFQANNIEFIKSCVLQGMGIAQFHEYVVTDDIKHGRLVEILSDEFTNQQTLYIYYQKNRFVQPKVRQLVNLLCEI